MRLWFDMVNQLWAIDANWRHNIRNVRYGRLTPDGVKAAFSPFLVLSVRILCSIFGLLLATNRRYSVMASGRAISN